MVEPTLRPSGLRTPSLNDVRTLKFYVAASDFQAVPGRLRARDVWPEAPASDDFGFSIRPDRVRAPTGLSEGRGTQFRMWTSDRDPEDSNLGLAFAIFDKLEDFQLRSEAPESGFSIRCMRDAD